MEITCGFGRGCPGTQNLEQQIVGTSEATHENSMDQLTQVMEISTELANKQENIAAFKIEVEQLLTEIQIKIAGVDNLAERASRVLPLLIWTKLLRRRLMTDLLGVEGEHGGLANQIVDLVRNAQTEDQLKQGGLQTEHFVELEKLELSSHRDTSQLTAVFEIMKQLAGAEDGLQRNLQTKYRKPVKKESETVASKQSSGNTSFEVVDDVRLRLGKAMFDQLKNDADPNSLLIGLSGELTAIDAPSGSDFNVWPFDRVVVAIRTTKVSDPAGVFSLELIDRFNFSNFTEKGEKSKYSFFEIKERRIEAELSADWSEGKNRISKSETKTSVEGTDKEKTEGKVLNFVQSEPMRKLVKLIELLQAEITDTDEDSAKFKKLREELETFQQTIQQNRIDEGEEATLELNVQVGALLNEYQEKIESLIQQAEGIAQKQVESIKQENDDMDSEIASTIAALSSLGGTFERGEDSPQEEETETQAVLEYQRGLKEQRRGQLNEAQTALEKKVAEYATDGRQQLERSLEELEASYSVTADRDELKRKLERRGEKVIDAGSLAEEKEGWDGGNDQEKEKIKAEFERLAAPLLLLKKELFSCNTVEVVYKKGDQKTIHTLKTSQLKFQRTSDNDTLILYGLIETDGKEDYVPIAAMPWRGEMETPQAAREQLKRAQAKGITLDARIQSIKRINKVEESPSSEEGEQHIQQNFKEGEISLFLGAGDKQAFNRRAEDLKTMLGSNKNQLSVTVTDGGEEKKREIKALSFQSDIKGHEGATGIAVRYEGEEKPQLLFVQKEGKLFHGQAEVLTLSLTERVFAEPDVTVKASEGQEAASISEEVLRVKKQQRKLALAVEQWKPKDGSLSLDGSLLQGAEPSEILGLIDMMIEKAGRRLMQLVVGSGENELTIDVESGTIARAGRDLLRGGFFNQGQWNGSNQLELRPSQSNPKKE